MKISFARFTAAITPAMNIPGTFVSIVSSSNLGAPVSSSVCTPTSSKNDRSGRNPVNTSTSSLSSSCLLPSVFTMIEYGLISSTVDFQYILILPLPTALSNTGFTQDFTTSASSSPRYITDTSAPTRINSSAASTPELRAPTMATLRPTYG